MSLFTSALVFFTAAAKQTKYEIDYIHISLIQLDKIPGTHVAFPIAFSCPHSPPPRVSLVHSLKQRHFGFGCKTEQWQSGDGKGTVKTEASNE